MVPNRFGVRFGNLFSDRSDRACVVAAGAWIDSFLAAALAGEVFDRKPPATLARRIDAAFKLGWIDQDLKSDLHAIRSLRNEFAHLPNADSLQGGRLDHAIQSLRIPKREYNDWGRVQVVATPRGFTMFTGEPPEHAGEQMYVGSLLFRMGLEVVLVVLLGSLPLGVELEPGGDPAQVQLASYLRGHQQPGSG